MTNKAPLTPLSLTVNATEVPTNNQVPPTPLPPIVYATQAPTTTCNLNTLVPVLSTNLSPPTLLPPSIMATKAPTTNQAPVPRTTIAPPTADEHQNCDYSFEYLFSESPPPLPPPIVTHSFSAIEQIDQCNEKIKKLEERIDALVVAQKSLIDANKLLMERVMFLEALLPVTNQAVESRIPLVPVSNHTLESHQISTPLMPPEVVIAKYPKLRGHSKIGSLAVKLA